MPGINRFHRCQGGCRRQGHARRAVHVDGGNLCRAVSDQENGVLASRYAADLAQWRTLCERHRNDANDKLRALAREFLLDWDVIVRHVTEPHLPQPERAWQSRYCQLFRSGCERLNLTQLIHYATNWQTPVRISDWHAYSKYRASIRRDL